MTRNRHHAKTGRHPAAFKRVRVPVSAACHAGQRRRLVWVLVCAVALWGLVSAPLARADVFGADESVEQANAQPTLQAQTTYSGAFSAPQDIDYLAFDVPQPETLRFDIANTLTKCSPFVFPSEPTLERESGCPMWGSLIEANGQQLGGEGSGAGTGPVEYAAYEEIEWSFAAPGRYYLVLESNYYGDLPTFQISYSVVPPGSGTGSGGSGGSGGGSGGSQGGSGTSGSAGGAKGTATNGSHAGGSGASPGTILAELFAQSTTHSLISSVALAGRQRGGRVIVRVVLAQRLASLEFGLIAWVGRHHRRALLGHVLRKHPIAGPQSVSIPVKVRLPALAHHYVRFTVRVRAVGLDGSVQIVQRQVLLRR